MLTFETDALVTVAVIWTPLDIAAGAGSSGSKKGEVTSSLDQGLVDDNIQQINRGTARVATVYTD